MAFLVLAMVGNAVGGGIFVGFLKYSHVVRGGSESVIHDGFEVDHMVWNSELFFYLPDPFLDRLSLEVNGFDGKDHSRNDDDEPEDSREL